MFLFFWSLFLSRFCVQILLSFLNPFVNCGIDLGKIILLLVLCILLVPPTLWWLGAQGHPILQEKSRNQMLVFWLHTQTTYWARTCQRDQLIFFLSIGLTWLVISLTKDEGLKARQLCGNNTRVSVRGCHQDRGGYRRFPLIKKIRQLFGRVARTLFCGSVPEAPFTSPTRWHRLLSQLVSITSHVFFSSSWLQRGTSLPPLLLFREIKTTGPFNLKFYLFKTQQANMGEQSS